MKNLFNKAKKRLYNAFYYNSNVEILGNEKVIAQNCQKILECDDILVKLKTEFYIIYIWGDGLSVSDYNKEFVIVNGKILKMEIEERK